MAAVVKFKVLPCLKGCVA